MIPSRHHSKRKYALLAFIVLIALSGGLILTHLHHRPAPHTFQIGMIRNTEINLAPEVGGYLKEIPVKKGDLVHAGQIVAVLSNPDIEAAVWQAQRELDQAKAARARVYVGVRAEEVESAGLEVEKSRSNLALAQAEYNRAAQLIRDNNVSRQVLDDRTTQLVAARSALAVSEAAFAKVKRGTTDEEKAKADRTVDLADTILAAAHARQDKLVLRAPSEVKIGNIVFETGEAVIIGQPIMTLEETSDMWFAFNIREDFLKGLTIGSTLSLKTGDGNSVKAVVSGLRNLGDFAVWHAERASSYDLATFEVRAEPTADAPAHLQAGMSVWIDRTQ